jgi:hypothetical protein
MVRRVAVVGVAALLLGGAAQGASTAAPQNTAPPTISGTQRAGETLTASSGTWNNNPTSFHYQWQRCNKNGGSCNKIGSGTNQTYVLQKSDVGHTIRVSVTATNGDGSSNAQSSATGVIANGLAPAGTSAPAITGTARAGLVLTASNGSWANNPTSFDYQWRRCDTSGHNCSNIGQNKNTYQVDAADIGHTIRVQVKARNDYGANTASSGPTPVVVAGANVPANSVPPVISGLPRNGQLLVTSNGTWANAPSHFSYQWLRCDSVGNGCLHFGVDAQSQRLNATEVGHTIRVTVTATNANGEASSTSVPTAIVTNAAGPSSIPVSQVSPPDRLVISRVQFIPSRLHSRASFVARFRITNLRGTLVNGALVYAIGLPYGWVRNAPEVVTGSDGWASIQFFPTRLMPIRRAALVMFVRARKPGESLLSGVSSRRLVQVGIG